mmetsp:Transcript_33870/g.40962  ORF Transcript_33870/g.40962 Transcript_33870/m.40962 type:complete len:109 (-) Transcript_33870:189-515(-)
MSSVEGRVAEWKTRKAAHAQDPLEALSQRQQNTHKPGSEQLGTSGGGEEEGPTYEVRAGEEGGPTYEVRALGTLIGRSTRVQHVNNRYYFPLEDCKLKYFQSSNKRWR